MWWVLLLLDLTWWLIEDCWRQKDVIILLRFIIPALMYFLSHLCSMSVEELGSCIISLQYYFLLSLAWAYSHDTYLIEPVVTLTGFYNDGEPLFIPTHLNCWIVVVQKKMSIHSLTNGYSWILSNLKTTSLQLNCERKVYWLIESNKAAYVSSMSNWWSSLRRSFISCNTHNGI